MRGIVSGEVRVPVFLGTAPSIPVPSVLSDLHCAGTTGQDSAHPTTSKATLPPSTLLSVVSSVSSFGFKLHLLYQHIEDYENCLPLV